MSCPSCASGNVAEFAAEINIHVDGKNLDQVGVLVFPKISVCLDCGVSRFTTPETEVTVLARGNRVSEAKSGRASVGNDAFRA
jgi:hypothetical protein